MSIEQAEAFWTAVGAYLGAGAMFAIVYLAVFARRLDPGARRASPGFALFVAPGLALLWPAMLVRLLSGRVVNRIEPSGEA